MILFHIGVPVVSGGFIGVDVFFVISGFLITGFIVAARESDQPASLTDFYARRVRRLLPAGLVVLIACAVANLALAPDQRHASFTAAAMAAAGYASNLQFIADSFSYFDAEVTRNPVLHTWSLGVEAQFYLLWPLLLAVVPGRRTALCAAITVVLILSFAASVQLTSVNSTAAFFSLPTRLWEFAVGGVLATLPRNRALPRGLGDVIGLLGLGSIALAAIMLSRDTLYPGWAALLPVTGTGLIILAVADTGLINRGLASRPMQVLGQLSYGWYLWHWPILIFASAVAPDLGLAARAVLAVSALGLAAVSLRVIEIPIRRSRALASRPGLTLVLGAAAVGVTMLLILVMSPEAGRYA